MRRLKVRLHCQEHGYMDEKTGPMAECPYCHIDILEERFEELRQQLNNADKQAAMDILKLIDVKTAITGGGNQYHIAVPVLKLAIKEKFRLEL
jgi:hypothetical protein